MRGMRVLGLLARGSTWGGGGGGGHLLRIPQAMQVHSERLGHPLPDDFGMVPPHTHSP